MSATLLSEETKKKQNSQLLVLKHGQNRVMVKRRRYYKLMLESACKCFPGILRDVVTLQTNELDVCEGHYVNITAEIWDDVIDLLNVIEVTRCEEMTSPVPLPLGVRHATISSPDNQSTPSRVNKQDSSNDGKVTIKLVSPSGEIQTTRVSREMRVDKLIADGCKTLGHPTDFMAIQSVGGGMGGVFMKEKWSLRSYEVRDGSTISLHAKGLMHQCLQLQVIWQVPDGPSAMSEYGGYTVFYSNFGPKISEPSTIAKNMKNDVPKVSATVDAGGCPLASLMNDKFDSSH
ncbi:hypothetical protein F4604DRAFT_1686834 [Suillus subluteus]|nr:hypothetical protein F4604DRAFT_1686834 [Suillus subluteus]